MRVFNFLTSVETWEYSQNQTPSYAWNLRPQAHPQHYRCGCGQSQPRTTLLDHLAGWGWDSWSQPHPRHWGCVYLNRTQGFGKNVLFDETKINTWKLIVSHVKWSISCFECLWGSKIYLFATKSCIEHFHVPHSDVFTVILYITQFKGIFDKWL